MHITVILASHNRKSKTVAALDALFANSLPYGTQLEALLVDDGSTDGTSRAVKDRFSAVSVVNGTGDLYWSRGMHLAQSMAWQRRPDFILWLNDDTVLYPKAICTLIETSRRMQEVTGRAVVVVGATANSATGEVTYSGMKPLSRIRRFSYRKVFDPCSPIECVAMNGNVVLIPSEVAALVGNLDPVFEHALGDIDYALRVRAGGYRIFVAPEVLASCSANPTTGTFSDPLMPLRQRWKAFIGRKGLPPRSWRHFVRRHAGVSWPMYFVFPYLNFIARALWHGATRRAN